MNKSKTVAELKAEYTDRSVEADVSRTEYARFRGMKGRIVTINENRCALVDFGDGPWYDVPLDALVVGDAKKPAG